MFVAICLGTRSADFKRLAANYIGRWDLMQLRRSNFVICTLAERLALTLLELSDNFGVRDAEGMRLAVPARHKDLAELAGASRPRVSEYLKEFDHKGFIVRKNRQLRQEETQWRSRKTPTSAQVLKRLRVNDVGRLHPSAPRLVYPELQQTEAARVM
jgi:hypothetical protein